MKTTILCIFLIIFSVPYFPLYSFSDDPTNFTFEEIENYKKKQNNTTPNDVDYFHIIKSSVVKEKANLILEEIKKQQIPSISIENLTKLIKMKQGGIRDFRCQYTLKTDDKRNTSFKSIEEREFTYAGNKLLYEIDLQSSTEPIVRSSYDGKKIIKILKYPSDHIHAGIQPVENGQLQSFLPDTTPISLSMLFDVKLCGIEFFPHFDLCQYLEQKGMIFVCEKQEVVDGSKCIVLTDMVSRIYLDVEKDYSVVMSEYFTPKFSNGILEERRLKARSSSHDFKNYGNGIWLPSRGIVEYFDELGKITCTYSMNASLIEVNKGIDDKYFTDFIPDNTLVADTANGLVYAYGDHPSIGGLLNDTVQRKTVTIFRWISVILGLAMIAVGVGFKIRKRMKERKLS